MDIQTMCHWRTLVLVTILGTVSQALNIKVDPGVAKFLSPQNGEYGNDIKPRQMYFQTNANQSYLDRNVLLPSGTLKIFYFYMHNISLEHGLKEAKIDLQIWRQVNDSTTFLNMILVWQQKISVSTMNPQGALHTVDVFDQYDPFHTEAGDLIGWHFEDYVGVISYDVKEDHSTSYMSEVPIVGNIYMFPKLSSPYQFSIGVHVDPAIIEALPRPTTEQPTTTPPTTEPTTPTTTPQPTTPTTNTPTTTIATTTMATTTIATTTVTLEPSTVRQKSPGNEVNKWKIYGPIIGVAAGAVLCSVIVVIVYKYKQHKQKSVTPEFTA